METRKALRLDGYDYSAQGAYFVTFCVRDMQPLLWHAPVGARIARPTDALPLSPAGHIVQAAIEQIPLHYPCVFVDNSVVMPNHVHILLRIQHESGRAMRAPTISQIINQLKGYSTKQIGHAIWQRSYYDHIIRDGADYTARYNYILDNPRRWAEDEYYIP